MRVGLVIGKFYPPHAGHHYVIDQALSECDRVIVGVLWSHRESIPAFQRTEWLRHEHPTAYVVSQQDEHEVDYDNDQAWTNHLACIQAMILAIYPSRSVTHVYGSEPYIERLARELDAEPVIVDLDRSKYPISGTKLRADMRGHWDYLRPATRAGLCKRIVCVGAESCGTTTLSQDLAKIFETAWVPEYGRLYSEGLSTLKREEWTHDNLIHIAQSQRKLENSLARHTHKGILICDTNTLATAVWEEFLVGPSDIKATSADLYILTDLCAWEDDGLRMLPGERMNMQSLFRAKLIQQDVPWIEVTGNRGDRIVKSLKAIDKLPWLFSDPLG